MTVAAEIVTPPGAVSRNREEIANLRRPYRDAGQPTAERYAIGLATAPRQPRKSSSCPTWRVASTFKSSSCSASAQSGA